MTSRQRLRAPNPTRPLLFKMSGVWVCAMPERENRWTVGDTFVDAYESLRTLRPRLNLPPARR